MQLKYRMKFLHIYINHKVFTVFVSQSAAKEQHTNMNTILSEWNKIFYIYFYTVCCDVDL